MWICVFVPCFHCRHEAHRVRPMCRHWRKEITMLIISVQWHGFSLFVERVETLWWCTACFDITVFVTLHPFLSNDFEVWDAAVVWFIVSLLLFQAVKQEERMPWWGMWINWWWAHQDTQERHGKDIWFLMHVLRVVSIHLQYILYMKYQLLN